MHFPICKFLPYTYYCGVGVEVSKVSKVSNNKTPHLQDQVKEENETSYGPELGMGMGGELFQVF